MSTLRRLNPVRFCSLLGLLPFLVVLVYPPWVLPIGTFTVGVQRSLIWKTPFLSSGIAIGQWALELGATLLIAAVVVGIVFYAMPKWIEK